MALSEAEVEHIAGLARLRLAPAERARLARELTAILDYMARLGALDLDGVSPTSQLADSPTPLRPDLAVPSPLAEPALAAAPARAGRLIRVPRVIG
jgi:aspartyl-tRNA(Asn)/glutamyl-tRNA(Gln) amidotransferase subunit C